MAEILPFGAIPDAPDVPDIDTLKELVKVLGESALTDEEFSAWRTYSMETQAYWENPDDHYANLALGLEDQFLNRLGGRIVQDVDDDERQRQLWVEIEKEGITYLGVDPNTVPTADFKGASTAIHPILAEACVQFQSRAMRVLWPAGGPVKVAPLGKITDEKMAQAQRVQGHMNYHMTKVLSDAREKQSKLLFRLPLSGSVFTKPYYDHVNGVVDRALVEPEYFVVPYKAESLVSAPRYTEICRMTRNDVRKRQKSGEFIEVDLVRPSEDHKGISTAMEEIDQQKKLAEGRENDTSRSDLDDRHTLFYQARNIDLPGFEDKDEDGKKTGIELPYLVVVDRDSMRVLHISRLWRKEDKRKRRLVEYSHYRFLPGLGFYGYGFYHLLGGMVRGATGGLRALLDAAGFANLKGGIKDSDIKVKGDGLKIGHGVFADVEYSGEGALKDHFVIMNYGEPSQVLYNLLGDMVEWARRLMGITETLVGEGSSAVPVGTQLSRIEQGTTVATEIHRSIHATQAQEFERIAELMWVWGDESYVYDVPGESREIRRQDFDPRTIDIQLVSDPEFITNSQRYYIAEASMQVADRNPSVYDQEELHRRAQSALQIQDVESLVPRRAHMAARMGPVEENAAAMTGLPLKAYPEQDHQAHNAVHQQMVMSLGQGEQDIANAMTAHIREHLALIYLQQMEQQLGQSFMLPTKDQLAKGEYMPQDPEIENQIAAQAAQAAQAMQQQQMSQPTPEEIKMQREMEREDSKSQADNARRDAMAEASIRRANVQAQFKSQIAAEQTLRDAGRADAQTEADIRRKGVETVETMLLKRQQAQEQPETPI